MLLSAGKVKSRGLIAAFATAGVLACGGAASAADMNAMVTKSAPMTYAPAPPVACGSLYDFFLTACPLTWSGVTIYGTIDMGGTYQTHGSPFDPNFPTGASYLLGAGGGNATNRSSGFGLAPNGLSQSNIGIKTIEPIAPGGWSFVTVNELAFDPYSGLLSNAPQAMQNGIAVPENQQAQPYDSSRWGWLAATNVFGFSQPVFGTVLFGRQNSLLNDSLSAYDPMGASYAFAMIGYSGKYAGAGGTEEARWTTAIKYRLNVGDFRFAVMGQPIGGADGGYNTYNPNNGAVAGQIGSDIKNLGPGIFSWDVVGTWEKDAVNIGTTFPGSTTINGWPGGANPFPGALTPSAPGFNGSGLKATLSNNTSVTVLAKYSFGSWGAPAPVVSKAPPPAPSGIPLTLFAGYEWIQLANPSDPQLTSFKDDGFVFNFVNVNASKLSANGTTINNNAFNALCNGAGSPNTCTAEIFQFAWAGFKYGITKNLDFIAAYYTEWQNTFVTNQPLCNSLSTAANKSQCQGYMDAYSVVLDWRFLPKWDAYIGTMYSAAFGGIANGDISRNNLATTSGVRFKF
jgi:predicted porin